MQDLLNNPRIIELPKINDPRGNLSFFENNQQIPFTIARTYWIYDVPGGDKRGGHAYKTLEEFIVALSGSFDIIVHNGKQEYKFSLNRSYYGLYVPPLHWHRLENFSTNALALIAGSQLYKEQDYIRDFEDFTQLKDA